MSELSDKSGIWFVYDGECPLCTNAAMALRIKQQYGKLHLLNAREASDDSLIREITARGLDLDQGMVIWADGRFYHGKDALVFMAEYADDKGLFNRFNKLLFRSNTVANICYPAMRAVRNYLLRRCKVAPIDNLALSKKAIFADVFAGAWPLLPSVMHKHYANRPFTDDVTTVIGRLDVSCSGSIKLFAPLFWLMRGIPPYNEKDVEVRVDFASDKHSKAFYFDRVFNFSTRPSYHFRSHMLQVKDNEMVEIMRSGLGWRMQVVWQDDKVKLQHKGYVLSVFGLVLPLPLTWLMGQGNAEETAIDENNFSMQVQITHPLWGQIYEYKGQFEVISTPC